MSESAPEAETEPTLETEAGSLVDLFNDATPDHAPDLEWFAMGLDREAMDRQFVLEARGYIAPEGLDALRAAGRPVQYIEGYVKPESDEVYCQINIERTGEVVDDAS